MNAGGVPAGCTKMKNSLASWTIAHFAVDMSCFYILYRGVEQLYVAVNWSHYHDLLGIAFLLYNVLAFGLQIIFGSLSDRFPRLEKILGLEGLDLMLIPLIMIWISQGPAASWISMIMAAILNAAFHVGGGVSVIRRSAGKTAPSGIFVSSGALGVIAGTICGLSGRGAFLPVFIVLVATVMVFLTTDNWAMDLVNYERRGEKGEKFPSPARNYIRFDTIKTGTAFAAGCMFFAVLIRSYAGFIWPLGFEKEGLLILLIPIASCLGKALGGVAADRFGAVETASVSLVISVLLFLMGYGSWIVMGLAVMFFNMAMPVTLVGLVSAMPDNVGFAFGLSTLALLAGYLVYAFVRLPEAEVSYVVAFLGIAAVVLIAASLRRKNR